MKVEHNFWGTFVWSKIRRKVYIKTCPKMINNKVAGDECFT